jgi:hypothetical protein
VTSAGFDLQDGSGDVLAMIQQKPGATIPGVVPPRDSGFTYRFPHELGGLDPRRPLVAWVRLSTGERFEAKPVTFRKLPPA